MSRAITFFMVFLLGNTAMMSTEALTLRLEPEQTVYIVGESLSLRCVVNMLTNISGYSFFKDAALIQSNVLNRLTIPSLSTMDTGNYFCTFYPKPAGTQQESNHIDLKVSERPTPPILTVEPKRNVFLVDESVVIRCRLPRGQSATGVDLYQNERMLSEADNFGVLSLVNTERRHTGKYTCDYTIVISGRTLTSHVSNQETLVVIDLPPTPILRYAINQKQTSQVEIVCEIPNPPSSSLIQGYRLYRNGGEISSKQANQFVINYNLEFDGYYFCRSFVNILGEEILSPKSAEVFLTLEGSNTRSCQNPNSKSGYGLSKQEALKPTLRLEPEEKVYIVGESLSMRCVADMPTSIFKYSFFKDTKLIANNSDSNRLIIPSLSTMDTGIYFCTYYLESTGTKPESNYIDLKVFERPATPVLAVEPKRNVFVVNESVVIRCRLPREQSAVGIAIYQDERTLYEADNFGVLSLANTERRYTGNYTCDYRTNITGRIVNTYLSNRETLVVIDLPPTPILRYAKNLQNQSRQVEIVCEIPNLPFSTLIHGYRLYRNGGEISSNQTNQFVINYNLEFDGCYFCRSFVNVLGEEILSRKSVEVFLTLEESNTRSCPMQNPENGHGLSKQGVKLYASVLIGKLIVLISILLAFGIHLLVIRLRIKKSETEDQSIHRL